MDIAVIGAGAWGTALAIVLASRHRVCLWTRHADHAQAMSRERENRCLLPGHRFPDSLAVFSDFEQAVSGSELLIIATPVVGFRSVLRALTLRDRLPPVLWVCKGFEAASGLLPHQVLAEELGAGTICGVLTGPSFADEVARGLPLAVVLASNDGEFAHRIAQELHVPRMRIYANEDLVGAEVGGAVKNVLAIATGICDGLGFGLNARAALMTRGLAEIARLGVAMGGLPVTFMGLAGMGDLVLTCTGDLSRNRQVGLALAKGIKLPQILSDLGHIAEGVSTAHEVARLATERGIDMPISSAVDAVLRDEISAQDAVERLLERDLKFEA